MAIVGNHRCAAVIEYIKTPGRIISVITEAAQAGTNGVPIDIATPNRCDRGHDIFNLEANAATTGDRHLTQRNTLLYFTLKANQITIFDINHTLATSPVGCHYRVIFILRKKGDIFRAFFSHGGNNRIRRVQHGNTFVGNILHNHPLQHRQIGQRGDVIKAKMITGANIGHHRNLALIKGQAFAQQSTPSRFENGCINIRMHQHVAGAARTTTIT